MLQFLIAGPNLPFTIALGLMLLIALVEGVGLLLGLGVSEAMDSILPDWDFDVDLDIDVAPGEMPNYPLFTQILGWLRIGQVPLLILLVIFLAIFGLAGLIAQSFSMEIAGGLMPGWMAVLVALVVAVPLVRTLGGLVARALPKDETSAVSEATFVGRVAVITLGTARRGSPAQGKLHDQFGQTHYVMVEPDEDGETFETGAMVVLVSRAGAVFRAIRNTSSALVD